MRRIGIFGGSFNPIHIAHLIAADRFVEQVRLERCYFVPVAYPPLKPPEEYEIAPAHHRLAMLERAIAGHPAFDVETCELERGGLSYTIDTIATFRQRFPEAELFLLIGADQVVVFHRWHRWEEIMQQVRLCIAPRPMVPPEEFQSRLAALREAESIMLELPLLAISSSDIRRRIARGLSVRYLIPEPVWEYIHAQGLYHAG